MKKNTCKLIAILVVVITLLVTVPVMSQTPSYWQKITGLKTGYSGLPDGIMGNDRENSYAWSMECLDGFLFVGTSRDVLAPMVQALITNPADWPQELPVPQDMRGRIYRMKISTGQWSFCYVCDSYSIPVQPDQPVMGPDTGYRMMKTFTPTGGNPVIYVGGAGVNYCRMLALQKSGAVTPVFSTQVGDPSVKMKLLSIRAITVHSSQLFWASEDDDGMAIWCSSDPLKQAKKNQPFERIAVPSEWFPKGGEVWDMISYNGYLYVFLSPHDNDNTGFWCAKLKKVNNKWKWQLIVGDKTLGAKYDAGMGKPSNGAGVPCLFQGKVYVGTMDGFVIRMTSDLSGGGAPPDPSVFSQPHGQQIYSFDANDKWTRVMPPASITDPQTVDLVNGFVNPLNVYMWRLGVQGNKLYVGTFDARTLFETVGPLMGFQLPTLYNPAGFDLFYTPDGVRWYPESLDGFGDRWNYGVRSFAFDSATNQLFMGTANPFYGCQVWKKKP
jgi:hypothetical protein